MKNTELLEKITELLNENESLTPQEMAYKVDGSPAVIQIHSVLAKMKKTGSVRETVSDKARYYSLIQTEAVADVADAPKETAKETRTKTKAAPNKQDTVPRPAARDLSKFSFDGKTNLSKGRLALAIIQRYVRDVKISTIADLQATFPDHLVKNYGVIRPYKAAIEASKVRKRYFINDEDVIHLKDGRACVTNQWSLDRISALLEVAEKKLSYQIKQN